MEFAYPRQETTDYSALGRLYSPFREQRSRVEPRPFILSALRRRQPRLIQPPGLVAPHVQQKHTNPAVLPIGPSVRLSLVALAFATTAAASVVAIGWIIAPACGSLRGWRRGLPAAIWAERGLVLDPRAQALFPDSPDGSRVFHRSSLPIAGGVGGGRGGEELAAVVEILVGESGECKRRGVQNTSRVQRWESLLYLGGDARCPSAATKRSGSLTAEPHLPHSKKIAIYAVPQKLRTCTLVQQSR